jgi:hypothetical protein
MVGQPWAYMLPIEPVLQDISQTFSFDELVSVEVPSTDKLFSLREATVFMNQAPASPLKQSRPPYLKAPDIVVTLDGLDFVTAGSSKGSHDLSGRNDPGSKMQPPEEIPKEKTEIESHPAPIHHVLTEDHQGQQSMILSVREKKERNDDNKQDDATIAPKCQDIETQKDNIEIGQKAETQHNLPSRSELNSQDDDVLTKAEVFPRSAFVVRPRDNLTLDAYPRNQLFKSLQSMMDNLILNISELTSRDNAQSSASDSEVECGHSSTPSRPAAPTVSQNFHFRYDNPLVTFLR